MGMGEMDPTGLTGTKRRSACPIIRGSMLVKVKMDNPSLNKRSGPIAIGSYNPNDIQRGKGPQGPNSCYNGVKAES